MVDAPVSLPHNKSHPRKIKSNLEYRALKIIQARSKHSIKFKIYKI